MLKYVVCCSDEIYCWQKFSTTPRLYCAPVITHNSHVSVIYK